MAETKESSFNNGTRRLPYEVDHYFFFTPLYYTSCTYQSVVLPISTCFVASAHQLQRSYVLQWEAADRSQDSRFGRMIVASTINTVKHDRPIIRDYDTQT